MWLWLWLLKTVESIAPPEEVKCCNWWWWSIIAIDDDEEEEELEEEDSNEDMAFSHFAPLLMTAVPLSLPAPELALAPVLFFDGRSGLAGPSRAVFIGTKGAPPPRLAGGETMGGGTVVEVEVEGVALLLLLLLLLDEEEDEEEEEEEEEDEDDDDVAFLRTAMFLTFSNASRNAFCTATAL